MPGPGSILREIHRLRRHIKDLEGKIESGPRQLKAQQNKIDAVIASNDGTALGELQAMKAQGLAGIVPISGQDATADGCNSIVKGEQTVSVYKDIRLLSPMAVDMMDALLKGKPVTGLQEFTLKLLTGEDLEGSIQALFLPVVQVTKDNVYELIVKSVAQIRKNFFRPKTPASHPVAGMTTALAAR